ncbi:hypothetical protein HDU76_013545 [Blyttiomyces sp. JEL0837]|nr:hypothetical protein HDU76_013545 [Blyttiomyces sp. JEL0837]
MGVATLDPPTEQLAGLLLNPSTSKDQTGTTTNIADEPTNTPTGNEKITRTHPVPPDPFEESVYSLIPLEYIPPAKQSMYRSKFAFQARKEYVDGRRNAASMGPAKVQLHKPGEFMKKGTRDLVFEQVRKSDESFQRDRSIRKAPVPKTKAEQSGETKKDFIKQNALENINSGK